MKELTPIKAVFRKWPNGTIDALFPYEPADFSSKVTCYSRIGQHSSADYDHCIAQTKPATLDEYRDLLRELKSIGYDVTVIKRANRYKRCQAHTDLFNLMTRPTINP